MNLIFEKNPFLYEEPGVWRGSKNRLKKIRFASRVSRFRRGTWDHQVPKLRNSSENFGTVSQRGFAF
jgi:hypothetical protein